MVLRNSRLREKTSQLFDSFNASISFDQELAEDDLLGSIAHCQMLIKSKLVSPSEGQKIIKGLKHLQKEFQQGKLKFSESLEDVHMNIEDLLHKKIGAVAGKLHTGRSRNDQVALDIRLYLRRQLVTTANNLLQLIETLATIATQAADQMIPGYTHLQRAQPVLLSHYLLAYAWKFNRDLERLLSSWERLNRCPLGAGALAGSGLAIDREYTARLLNFSSPTANSMDSVSDRDHLLEYLSAAAISFTHLSGLSEELILWASQEFSFVELPDEFCQTSSMMPQKKNPDLLELVRGKSGRINGNLIRLLTILKGLSQTYFKDLQEDKEPLFDSVKTWNQSLVLINQLLRKTKFNSTKISKEVYADYSNATDLADYLTTKGLSFRDAHQIVGQLVPLAIKQKKYLLDLPLAEYRKFSQKFTADLYAYIDPKNIIKRRKVMGSTGPLAVKEQQRQLSTLIKNQRKQLEKYSTLLGPKL